MIMTNYYKRCISKQRSCEEYFNVYKYLIYSTYSNCMYAKDMILTIKVYYFEEFLIFKLPNIKNFSKISPGRVMRFKPGNFFLLGLFKKDTDTFQVINQ